MNRTQFMRAAVIAAGICLAGEASAQALDCPQPQPQSLTGVIKETPSQIAELAPILGGGDAVLDVPKVIAALKTRYPNAGPAEIANYLITAYCPGVAKAAGLSEAEKSARVRAFSKAVLNVLY